MEMGLRLLMVQAQVVRQYVPLLVWHICCMLCMESTLIMPVEDNAENVNKCGR